MSQSISIRLFGMLAEKANWTNRTIELPAEDIEDLKSFFEQEFPELNGMDFTIAVDQELINTHKVGKSIKEIALLPPFAGG